MICGPYVALRSEIHSPEQVRRAARAAQPGEAGHFYLQSPTTAARAAAHSSRAGRQRRDGQAAGLRRGSGWAFSMNEMRPTRRDDAAPPLGTQASRAARAPRRVRKLSAYIYIFDIIQRARRDSI